MGHLEIVSTICHCHGRVGGGAPHWHFTITVNSTRTQLLLAISYLGREKAEDKIPLFLLIFQRHVSGATWPNHWKAASKGGRGQWSAEIILLVAQRRAEMGGNSRGRRRAMNNGHKLLV